MLSRVADSLYWMARYLERAEHTAKLMDVQLNLMLDQVSGDVERRWSRTIASLGVEPPQEGVMDAYAAIRYLVLDHGKRSSVVSCIRQARENARQVREQISSEMWEQMNRLFHEVRKASIDEMSDAYPVEFLTAVLDGAYLFHGVTDSTMSHGEGWQFIQIGRYLERAQSVSKLLDVHFAEFYRPEERGHETADHLDGSASCGRAWPLKPTVRLTPPIYRRSASPSFCCETQNFPTR